MKDKVCGLLNIPEFQYIRKTLIINSIVSV
nr:MAG TPA: hypothetical protein [Bacteriophage sp.]